IDARELDHPVTRTADVCIIGAGAAGIAVGSRFLNHSSVSTIVLESGAAVPTGPHPLANGTNIGQGYIPINQSRLRGFGGTTNHWSGYCKLFTPDDFLPRPWLSHSGWPIAFSEYASRLPEALKICGVEDDMAYEREHILPFGKTGRFESRPIYFSR